MDNILYYPYINIPRTDWTVRALLYYNQVGSIVPQDYFDAQDKYDHFMRELVNEELVLPISPLQILERPFEISRPFIRYINNEQSKIKKRRKAFSENLSKDGRNRFVGSRIHSEKFDKEIFYQLEHTGLAVKENHSWFRVERKTANELMSFLASVVGGKLGFIPTTDIQVRRVPFLNRSKKVYKTKRVENVRREIVLKRLIPFPEQIDLRKVRKFKDRNLDLLNSFKNKVELIALDHTIEEESQLFEETMKELEYRKEELSAKMNESKFGEIIFGTVCGLTGAVIGFEAGGTTGSVVGSLSALPSLANSIYSALKIERIENINDQSGMKYLALVDKKIR